MTPGHKLRAARREPSRGHLRTIESVALSRLAGGALMVPQESVLVMLVRLVDRLPLPPSVSTSPRPHGRPRVYSDRLFLKAVVIMLVRPPLVPARARADPPVPPLRHAPGLD